MTVRAVVALLTLLASARAQASELRVQPDPANPIAAALAGSWRVDPELSKRLGSTKAPATVAFRDDAKVLATLPEGAAALLAGRRLHAAGAMSVKGREDSYVLTERSGTAEIVVFRAGSARAVQDAETLVVMLVRGAVPATDLLFLNGDVGKQPFAAFARDVRAQGKLEPAAALTEMARLLEAGKYEDFLQAWCLPEDVAQLTQGGRSLADAAAKFGEKKGKDALESLLAATKLTPTFNDAADEASYEGEGLRRRLRLQLVAGRWYLCNH